jgi:CBS domain-containing protein
MARAAVEHPPPLGLFGQFVVERSGAHRNRLDLKGRGVFPLTQAMRVCALSLGVRETHTLERLAAAGAHGLFTAAEAQELREAYEVICRLRLAHQLGRLEAGLPADNFVDPQELGKADRLLLKEAFRTVGWLQRALEERFQTAVIG